MRIDISQVGEANHSLRLSEIVAYFQVIEERINDIINTDSFRGEASRAMKAYFKEVHLVMTKSFNIILMQIESGMNGFLRDFHQIDESDRAILDEGYLEHIKGIVENFRKDIHQGGDDFNLQMRAASQVMNLSSGNFNNTVGKLDHELTQYIRLTEETNGMMHAFDSQQMKEVELLNEHLATLESALDKIDAIIVGGIDNFVPGSFANSPLGRALFNHMLNSVIAMAQHGSRDSAIEAFSIIAGYINTLPPKTRRLFETIKGKIDWCAIIGDPVNAASGNFIYDHVDIKVEGSYPLEFKRFYNSLDAITNTLGRNWTHTYDIRLHELEDGERTIIYGDSRQEHYGKPEKDSDVFISAPSNFNVLKKTEDESGYELVFPDKSCYLFDRNGQLTRQIDQVGNEVKLSYDVDQLIKVESPSGYLEFSYTGDYIRES